MSVIVPGLLNAYSDIGIRLQKSFDRREILLIDVISVKECAVNIRGNFPNQYHQLCWWSVFAPPGLTGAFPPKGGLANRSYITGGRLKAAPFLTTFRDLLPVDPFRTVLQYTS